MSKRPRTAANPPERTRRPAGAGLVDSIPRSAFRWRLDQIDLSGPWGWSNATVRDLLEEIIPKLHDFESMTWAEVEGATGSHFVETDVLEKTARRRLGEINQEVDVLFSLRITGRRRIWGVREGALYRMLWWDPEHSVCPSLKKHS